MKIEEILNTDHFTALPKGAVTEAELNCQESDEEIELYLIFLHCLELQNLLIWE